MILTTFIMIYFTDWCGMQYLSIIMQYTLIIMIKFLKMGFPYIYMCGKPTILNFATVKQYAGFNYGNRISVKHIFFILSNLNNRDKLRI